MPLFEFHCTTCDYVFEVRRSSGAESPPCPACKNATTERVWSPVATRSGSGCGSLSGFQ